MEIFCPEKYPGDIDNIKGNENCQKSWYPDVEFMPGPVNAQSNAVYPPPDNKRPAGPVPETTDQECDHDVDVS